MSAVDISAFGTRYDGSLYTKYLRLLNTTASSLSDSQETAVDFYGAATGENYLNAHVNGRIRVTRVDAGSVESSMQFILIDSSGLPDIGLEVFATSIYARKPITVATIKNGTQGVTFNIDGNNMFRVNTTTVEAFGDIVITKTSPKITSPNPIAVVVNSTTAATVSSTQLKLGSNVALGADTKWYMKKGTTDVMSIDDTVTIESTASAFLVATSFRAIDSIGDTILATDVSTGAIITNLTASKLVTTDADSNLVTSDTLPTGLEVNNSYLSGTIDTDLTPNRIVVTNANGFLQGSSTIPAFVAGGDITVTSRINLGTSVERLGVGAFTTVNSPSFDVPAVNNASSRLVKIFASDSTQNPGRLRIGMGISATDVAVGAYRAIYYEVAPFTSGDSQHKFYVSPTNITEGQSVVPGDIVQMIIGPGYVIPGRDAAVALGTSGSGGRWSQLFTGILNANGTIRFGGLASSPGLLTVDSNGDVTTTTAAGVGSSHLVPTVDTTYDIGSGSFRWKDAFFSGNIVTSAITATGTQSTFRIDNASATVPIRIYNASGAATLRLQSNAANCDLVFDGTTLSFSRDLIPTSSSINIGGITNSWGTFFGTAAFVSGVMSGGSLSISGNTQLSGNLTVSGTSTLGAVRPSANNTGSFGTDSLRFGSAFFGDTSIRSLVLHGGASTALGAVTSQIGALGTVKNILVSMNSTFSAGGDNTTATATNTVGSRYGGYYAIDGTTGIHYWGVASTANINDAVLRRMNLTSTSLSPDTSGGLSLGTSSLPWAELYSSRVFIGAGSASTPSVTLATTNNANTAGLYTLSNDLYLRDASTSPGTLRINTGFISVNKVLWPSTNAGAALGASNQLWNGVFSTTFNVSRTSVDTGIVGRISGSTSATTSNMKNIVMSYNCATAIDSNTQDIMISNGTVATTGQLGGLYEISAFGGHHWALSTLKTATSPITSVMQLTSNYRGYYLGPSSDISADLGFDNIRWRNAFINYVESATTNSTTVTSTTVSASSSFKRNTIPYDGEMTSIFTTDPSTTFAVYGDSMTNGVGTTQTWAAGLANYLGKTLINNSVVGGTMDFISSDNAVSNNFLKVAAYDSYASIVSFGYNDMRVDDQISGFDTLFSNPFQYMQMVLGVIFTMALPRQTIIDARSMTGANWTNSTKYTYGVTTSTQNATRTATNVVGRFIAIRFTGDNNASDSWRITIDGVVQGTIIRKNGLCPKLYHAYGVLFDTGSIGSFSHTVVIQNTATIAGSRHLDFVCGFNPNTAGLRQVLFIEPTWFDYANGGTSAPYASPTITKQYLVTTAIKNAIRTARRCGLKVSWHKNNNAMGVFDDGFHWSRFAHDRLFTEIVEYSLPTGS